MSECFAVLIPQRTVYVEKNMDRRFFFGSALFRFFVKMKPKSISCAQIHPEFTVLKPNYLSAAEFPQLKTF